MAAGAAPFVSNLARKSSPPSRVRQHPNATTHLKASLMGALPFLPLVEGPSFALFRPRNSPRSGRIPPPHLTATRARSARTQRCPGRRPPPSTRRTTSRQENHRPPEEPPGRAPRARSRGGSAPHGQASTSTRRDLASSRRTRQLQPRSTSVVDRRCRSPGGAPPGANLGSSGAPPQLESTPVGIQCSERLPGDLRLRARRRARSGMARSGTP